MNTDLHEVEEIFLAALEHKPETRTAFLRTRCSDDPLLMQEVASMLRAHAEAGEFLETPAFETNATLFLAAGLELKTGEALGSYRILSLLGEGGMGEVYLAEDTELGRKVAIKLIKRGLGGTDIVRHLRHEARILAGLSHPNIARLYGAAVTAQGVPYFIMEYIEGECLDDYCSKQNLTTTQRLELFRKVCSAVAYAHQHLVVHRDLKPANIRVTVEGEPKLLDFGIAKVLESETTQTSAQTQTLASAMTPEYASPEQVSGEIITTASDVYSLGVVLYELTTGEKPYRLIRRQPHDIARAVTEEEPVRPSKATLNNSRRLDRELDNIILMALRKEPARRYGSVWQLSDDIRRYLMGLPVAARKDTWTYRSAKFIRRHRVGVATACLVVFTLLLGIIATAWQARVARQEKAKAQTINAFLEQMLSYANPYLDTSRTNGRTTSMKEVLDNAAKRIESDDFANQPEIKAELERIIAYSYNGQGDQKLADEHMQKYISLESKLHAPNDPSLLPASAASAGLLFGKGELAQSELLYRQIVPRMRIEYAKDSVSAEDLVETLNNFAYLRRTQGASEEAELLFRETLALSPKLPKASRFPLGITRSTLASTLADEGKFDEALETARGALADGRRAGRTDTPDFGFSLTILGGFLCDKLQFNDADAALAEAETIFRRLLGPAHLWLGDNLRNQAISFYQQGRYAEAEAKVNEALKIYLESFGPHYDQYPTTLITQGLIFNKTGRSGEAEVILREAVRLRTNSLPKDHFWIAMAKSALGECLTTQKRFNEAEPLLLDSRDTLRTRFGAEDPRTLQVERRLTSLHNLSQH